MNSPKFSEFPHAKGLLVQEERIEYKKKYKQLTIEATYHWNTQRG